MATVKEWDLLFPCYIEHDPDSDTYGGYCEGAPVYVGGKAHREEALRALQEALAFYLAHLEVEGRPLPEPPAEAPPPEAGLSMELVWLRPAPVNPVSLEIEQMMRARGLKRSELARRLGVTPAAVTRLLDPLYFGHSLATLRRVAEALDSDLDVRFVS